MDFDIALTRPEYFYVRYSDDIMILSEDKERLYSLLSEITTRLGDLRLLINEEKTICGELASGADFLGYHFDSSGKSIPTKAEDRLYDRLETMWLTNPTLDVKEKAAKALEITGGWQQYYRGERAIRSIYEFVAFVFATGGRREVMDRLEKNRVLLENPCRDITEQLALFWKKNEKYYLELLEYEQYYGLPVKDFHRSNLDGSKMKSLLGLYRRHFVLESADSAAELMQLYTDMQEYSNAQYWMEQAEHIKLSKERFASLSRRSGYTGSLIVDMPGSKKLPDEEEKKTTSENILNTEEASTDIMQAALKITRRTPSLMLEAFAGREDIFSAELHVGSQHRKTELQELPLTELQIEEHLRGDRTIGTYIQRPNSTVWHIVWDVDISKAFILKYGSGGESFDACLQRAYHKALEIQKLLDNKGLHTYIEFSGFRGYHVWLFLDEWIPVRFANMLTDRVEEEIVAEQDITVECFPSKVRLKAGRLGQVMKLPCGIHVRSGKRSCFINEDGSPVTEINSFVETIVKHTLSAVRKVLSYTMTASLPVLTVKKD